MVLSPNVAQVKPSITLAVSAKAKALKAQGVDVIALSAGEPDFPTPPHIAQAAIDAINAGFTNYTPASGTPELKQAVCEKLKQDNGLEYAPSQVIINCGAKHSVYQAVFALVGSGDEVVIPAPYWVSYPAMVQLAGGIPVIVKAGRDNDMKITPDQLRNAITDRTKLLILNSPSNPTGMVYTRDELAALAEVAVESGIYVLADEIYEKLLYDGAEHVSIASFSDDIYRRTITVNGVSKAYSMTGWRIGYAAGPEEVIKGISTIQSQATSNPCSISQKAAYAALTGPHDFIAERGAEFDKRRRYMVERLNDIRGVECSTPRGAFYVFPNVSALYGGSHEGKPVNDSVAFCNYILDQWKVAIVPGAGFGADGHVRLSYAASLEIIEKALDRFEAGVKALT